MKMMKITVMIGLLFSLITNAQNSTASRKIQPLPRDLEIQLALSALPAHLRDGATVYVLNPDKGFEVARQGTNGFHAFVSRNGDDAMRGSWPLKEYRDDILYPISFDEEGAKVQMHVFFDIAAMQASGTSPGELKKTIQERYRSNYYKPPSRPGVSYMLSPILRTYTSPDQNDNVYTINFPHVMYFAPNVSNADIGGVTPKPEDMQYLIQHGTWQHSPYPFLIFNGPHGYIIQARGDEERAAINKEYKVMLTKLCAIRKEWCLPASGANSTAIEHHH
jgi:hypothetical protein